MSAPPPGGMTRAVMSGAQPGGQSRPRRRAGRTVLWVATVGALVCWPAAYAIVSWSGSQPGEDRTVWLVLGLVDSQWAALLAVLGWVCAIVAVVGWWVLARPGGRLADRIGGVWGVVAGAVLDLALVAAALGAGMVLTLLTALLAVTGTDGAWERVDARDGGRALVRWSLDDDSHLHGEVYEPTGWGRWARVPRAELTPPTGTPDAHAPCALADAAASGRVLRCGPATAGLPR